mmetsp:Transcript_19661/g.48713  ORF Transcript_19661/g.48713 Transcript_19661/m.48713 type:complete len:224 (+) Transcript_19661:1297-1968(+)
MPVRALSRSSALRRILAISPSCSFVKLRWSDTPYMPVLTSNTRYPLKVPPACSAAWRLALVSPRYATMQKLAPEPAASSSAALTAAAALLNTAGSMEHICDPNSLCSIAAALAIAPPSRQQSHANTTISSSPISRSASSHLVVNSLGLECAMRLCRNTRLGSLRDSTKICTTSSGLSSHTSSSQCISGPKSMDRNPSARLGLMDSGSTGGGGSEKITSRLRPD